MKISEIPTSDIFLKIPFSRFFDIFLEGEIFTF